MELSECVTWIETVPHSKDIVRSKHNPKSECVTQSKLVLCSERGDEMSAL